MVGSGPNGLAAALLLARAGLEVEVLEGADSPGGGCRTAERTLPGYRHDFCSTVHPLTAASPFFRTVDLAGRGARLLTPAVSFAHPLDGGRAAAVVSSVEETARSLGAADGPYRRLFEPLVRRSEDLLADVLGSMRTFPRHPLTAARFGLNGLPSVHHLARRFPTDESRALLAGVAGHAVLPLDAPLTSAFALLLTTLAHSVGWPVVEGGSVRLVEALVDELSCAGGRVTTGRWIRTLDELPPTRVTLLDVTPHQLVQMAGDRLSARACSRLEGFRYGPGVFKLDWALSGQVPWDAPDCRSAATVHLGGTFEEIAAGEADVARGRHPERPFCIVVQPGVIDPGRAPVGNQTLWAYCHVPAGSTIDMTERIEAQIERFAPGFRDLVLARTSTSPASMEEHNPNYVGGDITAGAGTLRQTLFRPTVRWNPYRTGIPGVYLCSASTPPGGGRPRHVRCGCCRYSPR